MYRLLLGATTLFVLPIPLLADNAEQTVEVPYRLTDTKHVLVRVKFNGKGPFNFILDTGAPALILSPAIAEKAGIKTDNRGWGNVDLEIEGGLRMKQAKCLAVEMFQLKGMNSMGLAGCELHGVLGYTVLAQFKIQYDFTSDKLKWTKLDFNPPKIVGISKGGSQGGLEFMGDIMAFAGKLMGIKPNFEVKPRGFLGMAVEDKDYKVFVTSVLPGGPADKAGIKVGDRLVKFGRTSIDDQRDLKRAMSQFVAGTKTKVMIRRGDENNTVELVGGKGF